MGEVKKPEAIQSHVCVFKRVNVKARSPICFLKEKKWIIFAFWFCFSKPPVKLGFIIGKLTDELNAFTKSSKLIWAKQLTRLPCLVVYVKFQFTYNWLSAFGGFHQLQHPTWTRFWEGIQGVSQVFQSLSTHLVKTKSILTVPEKGVVLEFVELLFFSERKDWKKGIFPCREADVCESASPKQNVPIFRKLHFKVHKAPLPFFAKKEESRYISRHKQE